MATAESVKTKIQGLIDSSNEVTGNSDADLATAVNTLIAGYGNRGSGIYIGEVTPTSDLSTITVTHNLNSKDILFAAIWAETLGDIVPTFNGALGKYFAKTDIPARYSSAGNAENFNLNNVYNTTNLHATGGVPTSTAYWDSVVDENNFTFKQAGSATAKYITGVTYTIIIVAASAKE